MLRILHRKKFIDLLLRLALMVLFEVALALSAAALALRLLYWMRPVDSI
jgi:hypothetical protein